METIQEPSACIPCVITSYSIHYTKLYDNLMVVIPYYEQAIALDQNYAPAYRELGQLYSMAGRFNESKKYFEKYLELTAGNIPAKIRYVNALYYAKEYQEVIKNVEEIFAVDNSRTYMNRIASYNFV